MNEEYNLSVGDTVVCYKKYDIGEINVGDKLQVSRFAKSNWSIEYYDTILVTISYSTKQTFGFGLKPDEDDYFFDYFMTESDYRKQKIDKILE